MSVATNLFGRFYSKGKSTGKYQNVDYICSNADDGTVTLEFGDDCVQLVDSNGNAIEKLDLSSVSEILADKQYRTGSVTLNPYETRLIEGTTYGETFRKAYFQVPSDYDVMNEYWQYCVNVSFKIRFSENFKMTEYYIETVKPEDDNATEPLVDRLNNLFSAIGIDSNVTASADAPANAAPDTNWLSFTSLVSGYDFAISDLVFHNTVYKYDSDGNQVDSDDAGGLVYGQCVSRLFDNAESKVINQYGGAMVVTESGHYDTQWDVNISDELKAEHYYNYELTNGASDSSSNNGGDSSYIQDVSVLDASYYHVDEDRRFSRGAYDYPNGAALGWFFVPVYPDGTEERSSLLLNHVRNRINFNIPVPDASYEGVPLYAVAVADVVASERNEDELSLLKNDSDSKYKYEDTVNGRVSETAVHQPATPVITPDEKHIGMYGYLDWVQRNEAWTPMGKFYGLVTCPDTTTCTGNLASSVFLYNRNAYPVTVEYLICS